MTVKAHTYYIIFGRPPIGGKLPPFPLAAPLSYTVHCTLYIALYCTHGCRGYGHPHRYGYGHDLPSTQTHLDSMGIFNQREITR